MLPLLMTDQPEDHPTVYTTHSDVLLTMDSWNTLVQLCTKRVSNEPDPATKHPSGSETGESQYSVMYVVCKNQYLHMKHFVWLSTPVPVTDLMTDRYGNVLKVVPEKPGSASWRSMSGSLVTAEVQMLLGTWLVIATSGGRNDPPPVKQSSE